MREAEKHLNNPSLKLYVVLFWPESPKRKGRGIKKLSFVITSSAWK